MSISQNESVQAAGKVVAVFDQQQNKAKLPVAEKHNGKPEEKRVSASDDRSYVVKLSDEALKRREALKESAADRQDNANRSRTQDRQGGLDKVEQKAASVTEEAAKRVIENAAADSDKVERKAASVTEEATKRVIENAAADSGKVEREVASVKEEAAKRVTSDTLAKPNEEVAEAGTIGAEKVAGGLKDPGTAESKPETTQAAPVVTGSVEKAEKPEALERTGTVAAPVEKRTTERVEKLDTAEELRKSISVYA